MPTYDYRCKACGHALELFQSIREGPKRKCPACGRNQLERLIGSGAGILFKGSGFYQTDYRSAAYEKAAKAEAPASEPAKSESAPKEQAPKSSDAASKPTGGSKPPEPPAKGKRPSSS
jgi:putative FmdB family regulatory protein